MSPPPAIAPPVGRRSVKNMLERARSRFVRLSAVDAYRAVEGGATLIDVRTTEQIRADGHLPYVLEISLTVLEWRLDPASDSRLKRAPELASQVVVICNQGYCSSLAASRLQELGFARATDVIGGFQAWREQGLPLAIETPQRSA